MPAVVMIIGHCGRIGRSLHATGSNDGVVRIGHGAGGLTVHGRRFGSWLLARERVQAPLEGVEAGTRVGGDVVGVRLSGLMADSAPGLFLPAEFGAHPREGDERPEAGPREGERPA